MGKKPMSRNHVDPGANHDTNRSDQNSRRRHLLIVDDNELTCKQLQKLLQADTSHTVDFLTDGNQALRALEQRPVNRAPRVQRKLAG